MQTQTPVPTATQTPSVNILINTGGSTYTDAGNNTWSADNSYNTGSAYTTLNSISGTKASLTVKSINEKVPEVITTPEESEKEIIGEPIGKP